MIKSYFKSRYGKDGLLLQADFSQLEVVVSAWLSQDPVLISDLLAGLDMHCMSAAFTTNKDYDYIYEQVQRGNPTWINLRKINKGPSFQLSYGAGARGISNKTALTYDQAKQFIANYYERYRRVKEWQEEQINDVNNNAELCARQTTKGYPAMRSQIITPVGRRLTFYEEDAPEWLGATTTFSPTKIKNYPVQSTAFDIVALATANLWDHIKRDGARRVHFVNTIHDSVILDLHKEDLTNVLKYVRPCLTPINELMLERYGTEFNLPIDIEIEIGTNWQEMELLNESSY